MSDSGPNGAPDAETSASKSLPDGFREVLENRILQGKLELPVLPDVAAQLLSMRMDENASLAKVIALIERDQTLAASILRASNSVLYLATREISSLKIAATRLGLAMLREIVITVSIKSRLFSVPAYDDVMKVFWRCSASAGAWAKELAILRGMGIENAFLCGLLHDFGRPVALLALVDVQRELKQSLPRQTVPVPSELSEHPIVKSLDLSAGDLEMLWSKREKVRQYLDVFA